MTGNIPLKTVSNFISEKVILRARSLVLTTSSSTNTAVAMVVPSYASIGAGGITCSNATQAKQTATMTTTLAHRFVVGQGVNISGASVAAFNGNFVVTSVTSTTTFTFIVPTIPTANTDGAAAVVTYTPLFHTVIVTAPATNAAAITIGPDANADMISVAVSGSVTIPVPYDNRMDLSDWYFKSASASQVLNVIIF